MTWSVDSLLTDYGALGLQLIPLCSFCVDIKAGPMWLCSACVDCMYPCLAASWSDKLEEMKGIPRALFFCGAKELALRLADMKPSSVSGSQRKLSWYLQ